MSSQAHGVTLARENDVNPFTAVHVCTLYVGKQNIQIEILYLLSHQHVDVLTHNAQ